MTWLMLFVSGLLWAADNTLARQLQIEYSNAQERLGALTLFRLWDGAWWTIFSTGFHHGDLLHLLCNTSCLWFLGRLLETRLGSWRYLVFCLSSLAVSGAVQACWSNYVGLSGMLFAQFGLVWAWRQTDAWFQEYVTEEQITLGLVWLLLCVPLTWLNILPVANAAHFSGCFYGYLAGKVYFGSARLRPWKPAFLGAHTLLIPLLYFLVHPFWSGNYHWRRGDLAVDPQERRKHYEQAVLWDPNLDGPWINLAIIASKEGNLQESWDWALRGLRLHPSYQKGIDLARGIWASFPNRAAREAARARLREIFGDAAPDWEEILFVDFPMDEVVPADVDPEPRKSEQGPAAEEPETIEIPRLEYTLPPRALDEIRRPASKMPPPNPNAPGSAEEGHSA